MSDDGLEQNFNFFNHLNNGIMLFGNLTINK